MSARRVVVVGGGVAGLAAAQRLVERARAGGPAVDVVLVEAGPRLGGTIATEHTGGFLVEGGPDAFITEKPWALALCDRLGITPDLTGTTEGDRRTYIARRGRLHALPEGFLMLAPTNWSTLAASPLFSWPGKLRMALDLLLPARRDPGDESLASFVRRRLGREALERAADPLVSGIYTADPERLSLAATMPRFLDLERKHRSIILGLRAGGQARSAAEQKAAGARYSLFMTHRRGMSAFVDAIAGRLPAGTVRMGAAATALARDGGGWRVVAGGERLAADAVVLATPAHAAARLVEPLDAALARDLAAIEYASSATVSLGFRAADVRLPAGFGFVVPNVEGRPLVACTFSSRKFPARAPEGHELLRVFVGGARRPELAGLPDDVLLGLVRGELRSLLGVTAEPELARVSRWPRAMPQYTVGHLDRVAGIEARVAALPGLALAGSAYRGVGIPDCVRSGEAAADALVRHG